MRWKLLWTLMLACLVMTPLVLLPSPVHGQSPVKVTVTIAALEQYVLAVGGDRVTVSYFAPPNVDPHEISFDPSMVDTALASQLLVSSGHVAWETQLEQVMSERKGVPFSDIGLDLYRDLKDQMTFLQVPGGGGENIHGYWLLPSNAIVIAAAIEHKLEGIDPAGAAVYKANLQKFDDRVVRLQQLIDATTSSRGLKGMGVAVAFYEEQYVAYTFGFNVSMVLIGEELDIKPSTLDAARKGFASGQLKGIIVADIVQMMPVYQSLLALSSEQKVPIVLVTVFEMAALPDYVDMMAFNLGSAASIQKVEGASTSVDVSTYIYVIALLVFVVIVEGVILFMRGRRIG
jgi:ABC-type Zn uptake system ZnuABC Zn-binding protein ZnuA